jgi:signal transduction histidine kinase
MSQLLPRMIQIDAQRFQQVLLNLLTNANKFTEGGNIVIECDKDYSNLPDMFLKVKVKDQGLGIKSEDFSKLF